MDVLFHWIIPLLIMLAFSGIDKKTIILLSPFALFPEIDAFFGMHRVIFHNVFIVLIPLLFYFVSRKKKLIFILIAYFLLSHVMLDLAYPGVALLYPITDERFYFSVDFMFDDWKITPVIDCGTEYIKPGGSPEGEFASSSSIMVLVLILLFAAVQSLWKKRGKKRV